MRRLRLIHPPQPGHKCFELRPSLSIVEIVTSAATHAVMVVTGLRFLAGNASRGRYDPTDPSSKLVRIGLSSRKSFWRYVRTKLAYQLRMLSNTWRAPHFR